MISATLDTNIAVRMALAKPTALAGKIRTALRNREFTLVLSIFVVDEIDETLRTPFLRAKHHMTGQEIDEFVADLFRFSLITPGRLKLDIPELSNRDPEDIKIVEAAVEGGAAYLVTSAES